MTPRTTVIIGAGIGGLSAAIRLRVAGHNVHIIEKNPLVGGKMYQVEHDGYRFDTGPSVITMRHVFEQLFALAGRKLEDYLTLVPVDPMTRYLFADGTRLDATSNLSQMAQQIEQIEPADVEGFLQYLAYAARIHRITGDVFIYNQPPTLASFSRVPMHSWLHADPFRTMSGAISSFVRSPNLRQLLGRFATYVGGSPYLAPATLNVIAHVELTGGVWYPRGGIYQIAQALQRLAQELGVQITTNQPVKQIVVQDRTARGVMLANDEFIPADTVISNLDVATTYTHLLRSSGIAASRIQKISNYDPSCSGFILLLGVDKQHPELAHHNIFFTGNYPAEFESIFKHGVPAQDPTIYAAITSKSDPDHAPTNCENWFILVNAPPLSEKVDWKQYAPIYRDHILHTLANRGMDLRNHIRFEQILTPVDLSEMSGAWRGALYGPSANNRFSVFMRPRNRSRDIRGLYFAGGTTHPGGGVPMVVLSGKVAASMILEDQDRQI
jgi:phytoene desaturase